MSTETSPNLEQVLRTELGWSDADIAAIPGHMLELREADAEPEAG